MPARQVLTSQGPDSQTRNDRSARRPSDRSLWRWLGLAFLVVGGVDLILTWLPTRFGNPEWQFASVTATLNGLPVPVLGLGAMVWSADDGRRRWLALLSLVAAIVMLLGILVSLILWTSGIPLALHSVSEGVGIGLKKALIKTAAQGVTYPILLAYMIARVLRTLRHTT